MSRLIFFAQPTNIEWALSKLDGTIHLFSQNSGFPEIENVLLVYDDSFSTNIIERYSEHFKKSHHNIRLEKLMIPTFNKLSSWNGYYGLRHADSVILPPPGILFGSVLHEIVHSIILRDCTIAFCHPNPDGKNYTIYRLKKATTGVFNLPDIKMENFQLQMERTQTLKSILEKSINADFKTVERKMFVPKVPKKAIDIEINGTFAESKEYIMKHINKSFGVGFEEVTESLLSTNQSLTEIYRSVFFRPNNRTIQEEDFFVMTKSQHIIWISCKFVKNIKVIIEEASRLRLNPPLNFPKERFYSIVATSRRLAEKYASEHPDEKNPGVYVCHLGDLNKQISQISDIEQT